MNTPTPAQPGTYDYDEPSELDSETGFAPLSTAQPLKPLVAAKAVVDHFRKLEKQRGERFPLVFKNHMKAGQYDVWNVGIPTTLLRDLDAAFAAEEAPSAATQPFPALDVAQREIVDLYSGR